MTKRIFMAGATGTIGRATYQALAERGHDLTCYVRGQTFEEALVCGQFDTILSCMASRSGYPEDAWNVDYQAHMNLLDAARANGASHFILLSSICVQKPTLPFQQAKLAFEQALIASGLDYTIVRPTAYFKSLSGQIERLRKGKPFLLFGNGELTACKPVSDRDLATFLADCVEDEILKNRILPIGGPGEAITPKQQGELLFQLLNKEPRFRHVPLWLFDAIGAALRYAGLVSPAARKKAELARIGRYYAAESMLLLDTETGHYDAAATPSIGSDTLAEHYAKLIAGEADNERGEHAIF
jgi:divinyl chlorophyllide a 8-vinyl-reductase